MDLPLEGGMAMEKEGFQDKGLQQWPDPQIHWCEALLCDTEGQGRHSRSFASTQKHPKTESPETLKFNKTEASTIIYKKNPEKKKTQMEPKWERSTERRGSWPNSEHLLAANVSFAPS